MQQFKIERTITASGQIAFVYAAYGTRKLRARARIMPVDWDDVSKGFRIESDVIGAAGVSGVSMEDLWVYGHLIQQVYLHAQTILGLAERGEWTDLKDELIVEVPAAPAGLGALPSAGA